MILEKKLMDMYLESEAFPVELDSAFFIILILKHSDWFKDAYKCIENKKFSEKLNKKVLCTFHSQFNKENVAITNQLESQYFTSVSDKAEKLYEDISFNYEKYSSIINILKIKNDKKNLEVIDEIIPQVLLEPIDHNESVVETISQYERWQKEVYGILYSDDLTEEKFEAMIEPSKIFNFKTSFLEKFRMISKNFLKEHVEHYKTILFGSNSRSNMRNGLKKKKIELPDESKLEQMDVN